MLHGAIIYPKLPDDSLITALQAIRHVVWDPFVSTVNRRFFNDPDKLLPEHCNLAIVLDPEYTTFGFLEGLVRRGCHLFLTEKQRLSTAERTKLTALAEEGNTYILIRNDLLFHPIFLSEGKFNQKSKLIEIHQVEPGHPGALQEMLYNNLLLILRMVDSEPSHTSVCAIPNSGYQPDVVNLHLNFHNGSAASLTLSFIGKRKEHLLSVHDAEGEMKYQFNELDLSSITGKNATEDLKSSGNLLLFSQIAYFSDCILKRRSQRFGLNDEAKTHKLLEKINQKLEYSAVMI